MAAYVIADIAVQDAVGYEEYKKLAGPSIEKYGGRYLVRGGPLEKLEGDWRPTRLVILAFESVEQAKRWYASAEYERAKPIRWKTARTDLVIVEGA